MQSGHSSSRHSATANGCPNSKPSPGLQPSVSQLLGALAMLTWEELVGRLHKAELDAAALQREEAEGKSADKPRAGAALPWEEAEGKSINARAG